MATVTGFTAERMLEIEEGTVVDGNVVGDNLILVTKGGTQINAGSVRGPEGDVGPTGPPGTAGEKVTTGMLADFPKLPLPAGWLACDGTVKNIADYPLLAAYLGTTFGGNGTTTFGLPNYAGVTRVGLDPGQTEFDAVYKAGGSKLQVLSVAHLPVHSHPHTLVAPDHAHGMWHTHSAGGAFWVNVPGGYALGAGGATVLTPNNATGGPNERTNTDGATATALNGSIGNTGSGAGHNNLQPYRVVVTAIKI